MAQSWFQKLFWNQDCDLVSNLLVEIAISNFDLFHSALLYNNHISFIRFNSLWLGWERDHALVISGWSRSSLSTKSAKKIRTNNATHKSKDCGSMIGAFFQLFENQNQHQVFFLRWPLLPPRRTPITLTILNSSKGAYSWSSRKGEKAPPGESCQNMLFSLA